MKQKRFMSLLLTLCMLFTLAPFSAFAEDLTPAENATIYLTVNNKGVIATDNEGKIMANREVTVTDINSDGKLTCDEALVAAHKAYNTEDGYIGGTYVTKLWGIETANTLFFVNNVGLANGVGTDTVSNGDKLTASINKDNVTYADWYTFFDTTEKTVAPNEEFTLTLKGHLGMAFNEADKVDILLADISIGTWDNGVFTQIEDKKTDENGNVTISFNEAGTYYITAEGTVKDEVQDWSNGGALVEADCPIIAPVCIITVAENSGTETVPPTDDTEDTETPDTPPTKEEIDYNVVGNAILENIAGTYKDTVSDWIAFPEWYVMDMGAYENYNPETENKLSSTTKQDYVNYAVKAINAATKDTDIDKAVLGLVAISKNPELLYSVNSNTPVSAIEKLNGVTKSTSVWAAPYTLAVYNQGDYKADTYETELVNALLSSQLENGSWNEYSTVIDTTANAICGLSFYKDKTEINDAIEKALNFLSTQQNDTGDFGGNSNSTAMVVIGLCAAGVDLENDARFIKNGNNIIDGLLSFALADNTGFGYKNNTNKDSYATEQSFRALIAVLQTLKTGKAYNIYDFSSNELTSARETGSTSSSSPSTPYEPSDDNITVTVTIKADTGYWLNNYKVKISSDDATVYDAFVKACDANSITYKGAASGYVSSMTKGNKTLAEFDKGKNSGWLYKVNGELPIVGLTDYEISDGDKIVWYYTEDWTKDPSAGHYSGGTSRPTNKDENKTENKTENKSETATEVKTESTISGNTANVTTSEKNITNAITEAKKDNTSEIVVSTGDTKSADTIKLEIPANSVKEIAESKDLTLTVATNAGDVAISNETLNAIIEQSGNKEALNVVVETKTADETIKNTENITEVVSQDALKNATIVEVTITTGNTSIRTFGGHKLSVDVPVDGKNHEKGKIYKVHIISADGSIETTYGECVEKNGKLSVKVQTKHLSSFVVTDIETAPFTDIADHWAYEAIKYAYNNSIMQGVGESIFAPDDTMTRAMLVTVLYRLEKPTEKAQLHSFADVDADEWYAEAVAWAAENGIVSGVSETEFAPNEDITREQMAAILYRYAQYKKQDTSIGENTNILSYDDAFDISEYAIEALQWTCGTGIMKGETESTINPQNNSTRAQVATILMRYLEM